MKKLICTVGIIGLLLSCDNKNSYRIEGTLSNLEDVTLYVVFESAETNLIDTIIVDEKKRFFVFREHDADLQAITIFYNNRTQWFTVYPEGGKKILVKGDALYPQLIQITGGQINEKLSQFRKKAAPQLKKLADLHRDNLKNMPLSDEASFQLTNLNLEIRKMALDFIDRNPQEEASAVLLYDYCNNLNEIEQTENLLQLLSPELGNFFLVKNIRKEIERAKTTQVGAKAPNFWVRTVNGQSFSVDTFEDKYLVLSFTALWCEICQKDMKTLSDLSSQYSKDSLDILLISLDDNLAEIRDRLRQDSIQWYFVADSAGQSIRLFDTYNVNSVPKHFLIDKAGTIVLNTKSGEELRQMVDEVLKSNYEL